MSEIAERLEELERAGLKRRLRVVGGPQGERVMLDGREVLLLCSNNYLGLANHPSVTAAAAAAATEWGAGAGASRMISGTMEPHDRLERRLAEFHGYGTALLFGSGYLANTGVIAGLAERGQVVFSDQLNHASIVDGCRLARAETVVYRHRDTEHLAWCMKQAAGRAGLIVTDGLFSMDGDVAPLEQLAALARQHGCRLLVDEAHSTGALGPGGRGTVAARGLEGDVDILVGTLGKSLGSYGAYVCADQATRELLVNVARPFIYSTALPPPSVAAAAAALEVIESEPRRVAQLQANAAHLRRALAMEGLGETGSQTHIVPVVIGDPHTTVSICEQVLRDGVFAQAIRPPTVPEDSSRLRLSAMSTHRREDLESAARVIAKAVNAPLASLAQAA